MISVLAYWGGEEGGMDPAVCDTFTFEKGQNMIVSKILSKSEEYFMPKKKETLKGCKYFMFKQKQKKV